MKRSDFWLWCHPAGSFSGRNWGEALENSTIAPGAAARSLGLGKGIMVRSDSRPETADYPEHMKELAGLDQVLWSVIGDFSSRSTPFDDLEQILTMKAVHPEISGIMLDDFFPPDDMPSFTEPRLNVAEMQQMRRLLDRNRLEAWAVVYEGQLDRRLSSHLPYLDALNFWTWFGEHIGDQRRNVETLRQLAPDHRIYFGIYMWDFGNRKALTVDQMAAQFAAAEELFHDKKIAGAVILASCMCDRDIEAVHYARNYLLSLQA